LCGRWECKSIIQFYLAYENDFQCIYVYNIFVTDSSVKKWLEPHLVPFIQQKGLFLNLPSISIILSEFHISTSKLSTNKCTGSGPGGKVLFNLLNRLQVSSVTFPLQVIETTFIST